MILNEDISIKDLLTTLENVHERIAFLTNKKGKLIGCVTQGDIIRALLDGVSLKVSSKDIAKLNPRKIKDQANAYKLAIKAITKEELHAIPIIDDNGIIVSVISATEILKKSYN